MWQLFYHENAEIKQIKIKRKKIQWKFSSLLKTEDQFSGRWQFLSELNGKTWRRKIRD